MRLALLSDVHSNLHALEAVLDDVRDADPDATLFLGDAVGYNAHPAESVRLLQKSCDVSILGNHDQAVIAGGEEWFNPTARAGVEYSREQLRRNEIDFLQKLPLQRNYEDVHIVHGSPRAPTTEYVFPDIHPEALEDIVRHPSIQDAAVVAMGHTHMPFVRHVGELTVLNVGSVGQPRDRDPRAAWALLAIGGPNGPAVDVRRVDYDIDGAAHDIREAGLPVSLADRLYDGV